MQEKGGGLGCNLTLVGRREREAAKIADFELVCVLQFTKHSLIFEAFKDLFEGFDAISTIHVELECLKM